MKGLMGMACKLKWSLLILITVSIMLLSGCNPNRVTVYDVWLEKGDYEKALEEADKMAKKQPGNVDVLNRRAMALIHLGRENEALTILDGILAQNPEYDDALNNKSWALYNLEQYDESLDFILKSLEIQPNAPIEYVNHGNALLALDKFSEARDAYQRALDIDPSCTEAIYGAGCTAYWLDDYHEAIHFFEAYCKAVPNDSDAIIFLGYAHLYSGSTEEAIKIVVDLKKMALGSTETLSSDIDFDTLMLEAECQKAMGKYEEAVATLKSAEKINSDENLFSLLAEIYNIMGNYTQSIKAYERLAEHIPDQAWPYIQNVYNYLATEDIRAATEAAEKALALEPNNEDSLNAMGNVYGWNTQYRAAFEYFQKAVAINSDYVTGHVNSMWALYNSGLYKKCVTYGEPLLLRFPYEADIYGYLGDSWTMLYELDKALENYKKAYEYDPYPIWYGYQMAWVHFMNQDYDLAKAVIDDALILEPENEMCLLMQQEIEKKSDPLSVQIADFVEQNYLYTNKAIGFEEKLEEFRLQDASVADVNAFIESIRLEDDSFTFCLTGQDYDDYWDLEEGITVTYDKVLQDTGEDVHFFDIDYFGFKTANQFIEIAETLPDKDDSVLVIDLRDNGGGLMDSCTELLDYLLESCVIGNLIYSDGSISSFNSDKDAVSFKKIFILVDEYTASSSEMLTLGLKEFLPDVTIIGQPTYGKGVGQAAFDSQQDKLAVLLVSFYWNVKEENIMNSSIKPDIKASGSLDRYLDKVKNALVD